MPIYSGKLCSGYNEFLCAVDAASRSTMINAFAEQVQGALSLSLYELNEKHRSIGYIAIKLRISDNTQVIPKR